MSVNIQEGKRELVVESRRQSTVVHEIEPITEVEFPSHSVTDDSATDQTDSHALANLSILWEHRQWLSRVAAWALVVSTIVAFLIPTKYESSVSIMPPESMGGN